MKKLFLLLAILSVSPSAFAALIDVPTFLISVNGVVYEDSEEIILQPSDTATIEILGSDNDNFPCDFWLICQDPGLISGGTIVYSGTLSSIYTTTAAEWEAILGFGPDPFAMFGFEDTTSASSISLVDGTVPPAELNGLLVSDINLSTLRLGEVILSLVSDDFGTIYDRQHVLQTAARPVPEPMTIILLSLGSLLFVKRK
jgi:hypothetical protein